MRLAAIGLLFGLALGVAGCSREGDPAPQWLVHVSTDAPLPGLGDRLRLDVLDASGQVCVGCMRVFAVGDDLSFPLSFGVLPSGPEPPWVRLRLFRAEATDSSGDPLDPIIDAFARLPVLGSEPLEVQAVMAMSCFGKPARVDAQQSCDPATGEYATAQSLPEGGAEGLPTPGSWGEGDQPCAGEPPPGMICVPGGTFLLGSRIYVPFGANFDPVPEQLARVSPIFLDIDELTVAEFRLLVAQGVDEPPTYGSAPECVYTTEPGAFESWSVNCVEQAIAKGACEAMGKRLPTEMEWEYAAGGRSLETPYPWPIASLSSHSNEALCRQAVVARGSQDEDSESRLCLLLEDGLASGPQPGGSAADVSPSGLRNLGGNLAEWTSDDFARYSDPACWGADLALREDRPCSTSGTEGVIRGGSWKDIPYNTHVYFRAPAPRQREDSKIGFRCAKDAG